MAHSHERTQGILHIKRIETIHIGFNKISLG